MHRRLQKNMTADIATTYGMSEQSTDRVIDVFLDKVLACEALHIKIPTTREDLQRLANGFNRVSTAMGIFKGVVGAIDGWLAAPWWGKIDIFGGWNGSDGCFHLEK
jgi:hypothetical protein